MAAEQVASASESEVLVLYPHRWAVPRDIWGQLFDSAEDEIGVLVYSGMFIVDDPGLLALFRAKAMQGVKVRVLLGNPDSAEVATRDALEGIGDALASKIRNAIVLYRPLCGVEGVEIRLHSTVLDPKGAGGLVADGERGVRANVTATVLPVSGSAAFPSSDGDPEGRFALCSSERSQGGV